MFWHVIGSTAAFLTMFSFIPQIIKIKNSKSAGDISLITIIQLSTGVFLWLVYGIYLKNFIIITANSVTLVTLIIIVFFYFKYRRQN
ncbi:MAG: SemiSWEET family transporter [Candidatus Omnitrophota bacterium]